MTTIPRLCFSEIVPEGSLHAALLAVQNRRGYQIAAHTHDFYEIAFILAGEALHLVNGTRATLTAGQITFIRPEDCHAITIAPHQKLHKINVAFPA
ncbi:MAG: AraC family ligand binding domain-containing protein, partial [Armatimonadota bacterium]